MLRQRFDQGSSLSWGRLDLTAIGDVLEAIGARPSGATIDGEPVTNDVLRRLMEGYRYVDALLAERVDVFAYGQSKHLLELNHRVLCGITPERRTQFAGHIAETERRFYDRGLGGIGELHDWVQRNRTRPARTLAAGVFVYVVSTPQLFIEGNRRTAVLVASYLLARGGLPPVVITAESYPSFDEVAERAVAVDRNGFASGIGLTLAIHRVADFLQATADPRFLRQSAAANAVGRPAS